MTILKFLLIFQKLKYNCTTFLLPFLSFTPSLLPFKLRVSFLIIIDMYLYFKSVALYLSSIYSCRDILAMGILAVY